MAVDKDYVWRRTFCGRIMDEVTGSEALEDLQFGHGTLSIHYDFYENCIKFNYL